MDMQVSIDGTLTWQQYFLDAALDTWTNYQAMSHEAQANNFQMDAEYADYLAALPDDLAANAQEMGYESVDEMIRQDMGPGATIEGYLDYLHTYYLGYLFYGERLEQIPVTDADVESYFDAHAEEYKANGLEKTDERYVDVRHILISPESAAGDGTYTDAEWADLAAKWLDTYSKVPRNRVFVSGAGYNDHVTTVCADPRLKGTYLSLHHYGFWKDYATYDQWVADLKVRIGDCANRTVADEFGAFMTTGLDYNKKTPDNNFVNFMQAVTDTFRELKMGSVYWPGLRTDDMYSIQKLVGDPNRPWLATTNQSGADRLAWGWGRGKPVKG
jgi:hypothetical protein